MRTVMVTTLLLFVSSCSYSQPQLVGGPCEGCEAVFESTSVLAPVDTLPRFNKNGQNLKITGTIYAPDGTTPAAGVILYIYHTNEKGEYAIRGDEKGWGRRHGYIRGWIKTGADGSYTFYTQRPGSYGGNPAHIHPTILEPDGKYYWLESYRFDDDPLLTGEHRAVRGGGNGIVTLKRKGDLWVGKRDIILGRNVPGYE